MDVEVRVIEYIIYRKDAKDAKKGFNAVIPGFAKNILQERRLAVIRTGEASASCSRPSPTSL